MEIKQSTGINTAAAPASASPIADVTRQAAQNIMRRNQIGAAQAGDIVERIRSQRQQRASNVASTLQSDAQGAIAGDDAAFQRFVQGRKAFKERDSEVTKFVGECLSLVVNELPEETAKALNMYQDEHLRELGALKEQKGVGASLKRAWLSFKRTTRMEQREDPRTLSKGEALIVGNKAAVQVNKELELRIQQLTTQRVAAQNKIKWAENELVGAKNEIAQMELAVLSVHEEEAEIRECIAAYQAGIEMPEGSPTEAEFHAAAGEIGEELRDYASQVQSLKARRDTLEEFIDDFKVFVADMRNQEIEAVKTLDKSQLRTELQGTLAEGAAAVDNVQTMRDLANTVGVVNEAAIGEVIKNTVENSGLVREREAQAEQFIRQSRQRWATPMEANNKAAAARDQAIIDDIVARASGGAPIGQTQSPTSPLARMRQNRS